jgi:glycosyltransferase involved in cell wall biosynthesis
MRILHISSARRTGGGERHLADLANALVGRGHKVYAALPARSPLREELSLLPAQNIFTLPLRNALDIRSALRLARLVREHRIEVVHAHVARDYPLAALATRRNPAAKLIITRHVLFPLNKLHSLTLSHVARVICVSKAVKDSLSAQKLFPADRLSVIPNGIDIQRLHASLQNFDRAVFRRRMNIPPRCLLVGIVGEIKRQKGQEDFLRAAALIARQRTDAHFIIVGADSTRTGEHRAALEHLIEELQLTTRVHLTGWLDHIGPLLAALDVYVSASHTESFGLTIVEAMALGIPVVATATKGAEEIIGPDEAGVLVPIGDAEALSSVILRLLGDKRERIRLGTLSCAKAWKLFDFERMVDETERVYLQTLASQTREWPAKQ